MKTPGTDAGQGAVPLASAARVQMQIFPLLADPAQLATFCNRWFNTKVPPSVAFLRPALPVVFCTVLTYEEMGFEYRWHTGVFSQKEVYFLLPLEVFREHRGRMRFVEHGVTTPFIFVDNAESVAFGREQYGFPKVYCDLKAGGPRGTPSWAPEGVDRMTLHTWQPTDQGHALEPLLTITQTPRVRAAGFDRVSLGAAPRTPSFNRSDLAWWLQSMWAEWRLRTRGEFEGSAPSILRSVGDTLRNGLVLSCYNVRQVPHPHLGRRVLYRDLVNYRIGLRGMQNARLFGEETGHDVGQSVMIKRNAMLPIVERLGLRVARRHATGNGPGAQIVDELEAVFPSYTQTDMVLNGSSRRAWQFEGRPWVAADHPDQATSASHAAAPTGPSTPPMFDDYLGADASILISSPAPPITSDMKFMMLPAETAAVAEYIAAYFPTDTDLDVEPEGRDGWSAVRLYWSKGRSSQRRIPGPGWLGGHYLSISVPVRFRHHGKEERALLLLYDFSDNAIRIAISQSVYAGPTHQATFRGGEGGWFDSTKNVTELQSIATTLLHRSAAEARFQQAFWLTALAYRGQRPSPVADELATTFFDDVATIRSMLVWGGIPDPGSPLAWVERRCTRIDYDVDWNTRPTCAPDAPHQAVSILPSEDYPLVRALGMPSEPDEIGPEGRPRKQLPSDRVPVVAAAEGAGMVRAKRIEIIWAKRGSTPRTYRGAGIGVPFGRGFE